MRIYSQYNCQSFQALHVNPKTLKRLGTTKEALLKNASIKDCNAEKSSNSFIKLIPPDWKDMISKNFTEKILKL
mgnify:CR=1 FL=1